MEAISLLNLLIDNCPRCLDYVNRDELFLSLMKVNQSENHWVFMHLPHLESWSQLLYSIAEENPVSGNTLRQERTLGYSLLRTIVWIPQAIGKTDNAQERLHLFKAGLNLLNAIYAAGVLSDLFMNTEEAEECVRNIKPLVEVPCSIDPISLLLFIRNQIKEETEFRLQTESQSTEETQEYANKTREIKQEVDTQLRLASSSLETLCNLSLPENESMSTVTRQMKYHQFHHITGNLLHRIVKGLVGLEGSLFAQGARFVHNVLQRALECTGNMTQNFPIDDEQTMRQLWNLYLESIKAFVKSNIPVEMSATIERCIICAGSLSQQAAQGGAPLSMTEEQVEVIFQCSELILRNKHEAFGEAVCIIPHLLGAIVQYLKQHHIAQRVSDELLRYYSLREPAVLAEVCDALFDIFGDESFDGIYKSAGWQEKCKDIGNVLSEATKSSVNSAEGFREHMEEVCENLARFLEYKGS